MSKNELPANGDWESVAEAIHRQMKRLGMPLARLSRQSGISETTIRYIHRPEKRQRSTLVALSAALGWQYDYLVDLLHGRVGQPEPAGLPENIEKQINSLATKVGELEGMLCAVSSKADMLLNFRSQQAH